MTDPQKPAEKIEALIENIGTLTRWQKVRLIIAIAKIIWRAKP